MEYKIVRCIDNSNYFTWLKDGVVNMIPVENPTSKNYEDVYDVKLPIETRNFIKVVFVYGSYLDTCDIKLTTHYIIVNGKSYNRLCANFNNLDHFLATVLNIKNLEIVDIY